MFEKIVIFFDTNILETRFSKDLFLSRFILSKTYYEIQNMIKDYYLTDKVLLYIPEVVWLEMLEHFKQDFKSQKQSLETKIREYKKVFGDLISIEYEFSIGNQENYNEYITANANDILKDKKIIAKIIPYPKDSKTMEVLLEKATNSISPFSSAKGIKSKGKVYSDAGFKDALIFETMVQTVKDELCIFVTKDSDFNNAFRDIGKNNFKCVSTAKEVLEIIIENYGIITKERLEVLVKNDDYIKERILDEAGFDSNLECDYVNLEDFKEIDDGQEFVLNLRIEGIIYKFDIKYNLLANELIEVNLIDEEM